MYLCRAFSPKMMGLTMMISIYVLVGSIEIAPRTWHLRSQGRNDHRHMTQSGFGTKLDGIRFEVGISEYSPRGLEDQYSQDDDWWFKRFVNDDVYMFDDDGMRQKEEATLTNAWYMFSNSPSDWSANQWGFFAAFLTVMAIVLCCCVFCLFRMVCPCIR